MGSGATSNSAVCGSTSLATARSAITGSVGVVPDSSTMGGTSSAGSTGFDSAGSATDSSLVRSALSGSGSRLRVKGMSQFHDLQLVQLASHPVLHRPQQTQQSGVRYGLDHACSPPRVRWEQWFLQQERRRVPRPQGQGARLPPRPL